MSVDFKAKLLHRFAGILGQHVEPLCKPGVRLTLIARFPDNPEADVLVTADDIDSLMALLERSKTRETIR